MFRTVIAVAAIGLSGPVIGLVVLWLGCGVTQAFGVYCGHNAPLALGVVVVVSWVVVVGLVAARPERRKL